MGPTLRTGEWNIGVGGVAGVRGVFPTDSSKKECCK
jgi:hypothetical protein